MNGYPRFGWVDIIRFQQVPAFMCNGNSVLYMNMHETQYQDKMCSRLLERKGLEASRFMNSILKKVCNTSDSDTYNLAYGSKWVLKTL